ncbi:MULTISPECIES: hypothetical protein [unclassified Bradyrhizobium]
MTALSSYQTGTVSVANGDTVIVGSGTIWSAANARAGDRIIIDGLPDIAIRDVTDVTHLELWAPWSGGDKVGVSYTIIQSSPQRFAGGTAMQSVNEMVAALNTRGVPVIVPPAETGPDPSLGEEDQYAIQPGAYKFWLKTGGTWVFQGAYKGFRVTGPWSAATAYEIGDVVSLAGSSYVALAPSTNQTPPNPTDWQVLAAAGTAATVSVGTTTTGAPGTNANVTNSGTSNAAVFDFTIPSGKGYGGSSSTSLAIGAGSKTFNGVGTGLAYQVGNYVRASSAANGANFMEGFVTAYGGGNLTLNVTRVGGSGTFADWNLSLSGAPGSGDLLSTNNLSDVANAATAAGNLAAVRFAAQTLTAPQQSQARSNIGMADGQLPATATNDSAAAGKIGECLASSAGSVGFSNGATINIASITLTPGDWDVSAIGVLTGSPLSVQIVEASISTTSATLDSTPGRLSAFVGPFVQYYNVTCPIPPYRFSVSANTTIYLVMQITYNTGAGGSLAGRIQARRMR